MYHKEMSNRDLARHWGRFNCEDIERFLDGNVLDYSAYSAVYECIYDGIDILASDDLLAEKIWIHCLSNLVNVPDIAVIDLWIRDEKTRKFSVVYILNLIQRTDLLPATYFEIAKRVFSDERASVVFGDKKSRIALTKLVKAYQTLLPDMTS